MKKIELDVDFIGEQSKLSKEEEKAISEFFQLKKSSNQRRKSSKNAEKKSSK
ncbi:hypothetical protein [Flavobacterium caeni]|uniref:Uncharacterized protein n=1 Tax=Flavobacterium caeni TaxID=490189 RepID=A0A1G5KCE5_9FLAO|nr:hypothetical protein [Flavobacterium caeni]SCY98246.1 hypothetical protein SAMN02927903_03230 [Flavobacterium caeni]